VLDDAGSSTSENGANPYEQRDLADLADQTPKSGSGREASLEDAVLDKAQAEEVRASVGGEWIDD